MSLRAALALCLALLASISLGEAFSITRFDVDLQVKPGGTLFVKERISTRFTQRRRGIIRAIPYRFQGGPRGGITTPIDQIKVVDEDGKSRPTKVQRRNGILTIRIGHPSIYLPSDAEEVYEITYRVRNVIQWHEGPDGWGQSAELYWDAIGTEWNAAISNVQVTVSFPNPMRDGASRFQAYAGPYGSTDTVFLGSFGSGNGGGMAATLGADRGAVLFPNTLPPGSGLTVVAAVPARELPQQTFTERVQDEWTSIGGFIITVLSIPILLIAWMMRRRKGREMGVRFSPPMGLEPCLCGALVDETVDSRDLVSVLIGLAVKGRMTIHPTEKQGPFGRAGAEIHMLTPEPNSPALTEFEESFYRRLGDGAAGNLDHEDLRHVIGGNAYIYARMMHSDLRARGLLRKSPEAAKANFIGIGLLLVVAASLGLFFWMGDLAPVWTFLAGPALAVGGVFLVGMQVSTLTRAGQAAQRQAEEFRHFLAGRQGFHEWVVRQHAPQMAFEEMLPYAVAFGVESDWIKSFSAEMDLMPPDWYGGLDDRSYDWGHFTYDFIALEHTFAWSVQPLMRGGEPGFGFMGAGDAGGEWHDLLDGDGWSGGSGFGGGGFGGFGGGGGFSGGGFGGGGGGSW